jgi:hypothetical protein
MKQRTQLVCFCGNLLIVLYGILMAFHGFNRVLSVMLYFGKHDNKFPDGIESWVMPELLECRDTLIRLFVAFLVLLLFNSFFALRILLSKKRENQVA